MHTSVLFDNEIVPIYSRLLLAVLIKHHDLGHVVLGLVENGQGDTVKHTLPKSLIELLKVVSQVKRSLIKVSGWGKGQNKNGNNGKRIGQRFQMSNFRFVMKVDMADCILEPDLENCVLHSHESVHTETTLTRGVFDTSWTVDQRKKHIANQNNQTAS